MALDDLKDVYVDQIQDLHSACKQSHDVMDPLIEAVSDPSLKDALKAGKDGIKDGLDVMARIAKSHDADPDGEHCKGMEGLVAEARAHGLDATFTDSAARDAMIITQYQRMAHYAIAGYGSCKAFATRLRFHEDAELLNTCLDASYSGDRTMTDIAAGTVNKRAA